MLTVILVGLAWLVGCSVQPEDRPIEEAFVARNSIEIRSELKPNSEIAAHLQLGERVEILGRRRRFVQVRTSTGIQGWTRDTGLATPELRELMRQLREQTKSERSQGTFRALRTLNVHLEPYRWSPTIYQLQEDEAAELLRHQLVDRLPHKGVEGKPSPSPTGLDDWYLIRLSNGHVGWALATGLYSDIPDEVKQYAERRRITSYFALGEVPDATTGESKKTWLWTQIERSKLPYDFDRIRVFMWSRRRQSYQTIKLERGLIGYLPVELHSQVKTRRGQGEGFSIIVEKDGQRVLRTYAVIQYRVYRVDEKPAPPPLPAIRFIEKTLTPTSPPSLTDRLRRWWNPEA